MPYRKIPPFQSLIAFESAARQRSFKAAANELFLSPPAITYRIKELEALLGLSLFIRSSKGLELTEAGEQYYKDVASTLSSLEKKTTELVNQSPNHKLNIQMLPFLATEIVIPQLNDFYEKHPHIEVQIDTKYALSDFQTENVDVAIRFGLGDWGEELRCEKLMSIEVTAVCSSNYANKIKLEKFEDLNRATLVSLANEKYNWSTFFKQAEIGAQVPQREIYFNDYTLCLRAAENDMGVTLGVLPMIKNWIESKRLIKPFNLQIKLPQAYYFVHKKESEKLEAIHSFENWLRTVVKQA